MQKWEYLIVTYVISKHVFDVNGKEMKLSLSKLYDYLNMLGDDGWELVTFNGTTYFFKRPK